MPKPEIHYSVVFGMGFYIAEDGTLMSMPAFENDSDSRDVAFDIGNEIPVKEWGNTEAYTTDHIQILAQIMEICTLKRDYVRIGYYAERFRPVTV